MAIAFYETPAEVADLVARLALRWHSTRPASIVDACAGRGALGLALATQLGQEHVCRADFIEIDVELVRELEARLSHLRPAMSAQLMDVLEDEADVTLSQADIVLANPPFLKMKRWREVSGRSIEREGRRQFPDISCHIVLRIARTAKPCAVLGFIIRRDLLLSAGYSEFRDLLHHVCETMEVVDLGRRMIPNSGAAESVILIMRRRPDGERVPAPPHELWGRHPAALRPPLGWSLLSEIAEVRAGPSVRSLKSAPSTGQSPVQIATIPAGYDCNHIWQSDLHRVVDWDALDFAARRNMAHQGQPGFVYKLAAKRFVTAILPASHGFLSNCPAVQPKAARDLDFVTGCAMIPAWCAFVRECVRSKNLSPLAVAQVPVPTSLSLRPMVEELGRRARSEGEKIGWRALDLPWPESLRVHRSAVDVEVRAVIKEHANSLSGLGRL